MPHWSGRDFTEKEKERIRMMENPVPYKQVESWKVRHSSKHNCWFASVAPAGDSFRPWKDFDKKKNAVKYAQKKAKENDGELLIEKMNGRIQDRQVYLD